MVDVPATLFYFRYSSKVFSPFIPASYVMTAFVFTRTVSLPLMREAHVETIRGSGSNLGKW